MCCVTVAVVNWYVFLCEGPFVLPFNLQKDIQR